MKPRRVLVIDDEPDIRMLVATLLQRVGYEVLEAADGRAGRPWSASATCRTCR
jgi:CheY-like chemotaxis protein